jgi:putative tryptophan/tyrosine transport system substrate-binding protein
MKLTFSLAIILLGTLSVESAEKVLVVRVGRLTQYDQALAGFRKCLLGKKADTLIEEISLPEDEGQSLALLSSLRTKRPSLIMNIGTLAAKLSGQALQDIPQIFCMVLDPSSSNLRSGGVTLDVRASDQIAYIRQNFPSVKRLGVIHNPQRTQDLIRELKEIQRKGEMALVFKEVTSGDAMERAVAEMAPKVDGFLMTPDPTIYSPHITPQLIFKTLQNGIPFFAVAAPYVKAGALAAVYAEFQDNGCQAAEVANRVLDGQDPRSLPLSWPSVTKSAVNLVVAERLKIAVPTKTVSRAEEVVR